MAQRYIYLPDELNERLKQEKNVSALIQRLLRDFYKYNITNLDEIEKKIAELKENQELKNGQLDSEIKKLMIIQDRIRAEEKERNSLIEKQKNREKNFRDNFFKNFKDITNKEATEEQFIKFKKRFELREEGFSIFSFCNDETTNNSAVSNTAVLS